MYSEKYTRMLFNPPVTYLSCREDALVYYGSNDALHEVATVIVKVISKHSSSISLNNV